MACKPVHTRVRILADAASVVFSEQPFAHLVIADPATAGKIESATAHKLMNQLLRVRLLHLVPPLEEGLQCRACGIRRLITRACEAIQAVLFALIMALIIDDKQ